MMKPPSYKQFVVAGATFLFGLSALTRGDTAPAAGNTTPATQPAPLSVSQLIAQLGSDSNKERDAAEQQLTDIGATAEADLKKAVESADDPEIRSRASAVLAILKDRQADSSTSVTLHLKDATIDQLCQALSDQCHAQVTVQGLAIPAPGKPPRTISIDLDQKPFWEALIPICAQLHVAPQNDGNIPNRLRLLPVDRNWLVNSPCDIDGPFYFGISSISRTNTINVEGPQSSDDHLTIRMNVGAEPRLSVVYVSDFLVTHAADDAGNSLLPKATPMGLLAAPLRRPAGFLECRLPYPEQHPGTKISTLQGEVTFIVAADFQTYVLDDVLGSPRATNPLDHGDFQVSVARKNETEFLVTIHAKRAGINQRQWTTMTNSLGNVTLEDAQGHLLGPELPVGIHSMTMAPGAEEFTATGTYRGASPSLEARKLTWKFPTSYKTLKRIVSFKDLPMP